MEGAGQTFCLIHAFNLPDAFDGMYVFVSQ
jgi:hypothetical protein